MGLDLLLFEVFTPYLVFVTQFPTAQCKVLPYGQDSAILVKVLENITLGVAEGTCSIRSCFHWQEQSNKHYNSGCAGFVKDPANDDKNTNFNFIIFPSLEVLFS